MWWWCVCRGWEAWDPHKLREVKNSAEPPQMADEMLLDALFERYDRDGGGSIDASEAEAVLKSLGADSSPEHIQSIFQRFDADGSGEISLSEFKPFVNFLRGECNTQAAPFEGRGFTADLTGVAAGSEVVVFHEEDMMWYHAVVDGIYAAPEPAGSYYVITFTSIPGCEAVDAVSGKQVSVYGPSIRVKDPAMDAAFAHRLAQQQARIDERVGRLDELFAQVDQEDGEQRGDLGRDEVRELLRLLGADATNDQVELIFRHYDSDHSGTVSRDEFEMCLPILRGGYSAPAAFNGLNYVPEITEDSSDAEWARLRAGALVAVYQQAEGLWMRGSIEAVHTAERQDGSTVRFCTVTCGSGESLVVYPEAVRVRETESSRTAKQWLDAYDADGDGLLGRSEVAEYLKAEGMDCSEEALDRIFGCYDNDGSGNLSRGEFESFMRVASGEQEDPAAPPDGASSNLESVAEGSQVLAFFASEQLWYGATVEGVFAGKEQTLPDGSTVTVLYYTVRYNAYPDTTEVLNDSSLRVPPMRADDDIQSAEELAEEMRQLFDSVDATHDGALSPAEVKTLLEKERLDSSDGHVAQLFERFDADGEGGIGRLEFEPFLRAMRRKKQGAAEPPEPPDGTSADLHLLKVGDEVLAYYAAEGLWYPAILNGIYDMPGEDHSVYYSITYTGYSEMETVYANSLRAKTPSSFEKRPAGAVGWIAKKSGVRGVENLRYCSLHEGILTFYENEDAGRPISSVDMKHIASVGPCLAPKASTLEIELRMKATHVGPPLRMVCTTRQDRRDWLRILGALLG